MRTLIGVTWRFGATSPRKHSTHGWVMTTRAGARAISGHTPRAPAPSESVYPGVETCKLSNDWKLVDFVGLYQGQQQPSTSSRKFAVAE